MNQRKALLLAALLIVGGVVLGTRLLGHESKALKTKEGEAPAAVSSGATPEARSPETAISKHKPRPISRPEPARHSATVDRFLEESTDRQWSGKQEGLLTARLEALANPFLDALGVECQSSCCKMSLSFEFLKDYGEESDKRLAYNAVLMDLQSDLGFGAWASSMQTSGSDFYVCFDRTQTDRDQLGLERIDDRRRLLDESMPDFLKCLPPGQDTAMFNVLAVFHKDGSVTTKSSTPQNEISDCIGKTVNSWRTAEGGSEGFLSLPILVQ